MTTSTPIKRVSTEITRAFELANQFDPNWLAAETKYGPRYHLTSQLEIDLDSDSDFWGGDWEEWETINLALEMLGFDPKLV